MKLFPSSKFSAWKESKAGQIIDLSFFISKLAGMVPFSYNYVDSCLRLSYSFFLKATILGYTTVMLIFFIYKSVNHSETRDIYQASLALYLLVVFQAWNEWKNASKLTSVYNSLITIDRKLKGSVRMKYKFKKYIFLIILNNALPISTTIWLAVKVYPYSIGLLIVIHLALIVLICFCLQITSLYWVIGDQMDTLTGCLDSKDYTNLNLFITTKWRLGCDYRTANDYYSLVSAVITLIILLNTIGSIGVAVFRLDWSNGNTILLLFYPFITGMPFYTMLKAVDDASNQSITFGNKLTGLLITRRTELPAYTKELVGLHIRTDKVLKFSSEGLFFIDRPNFSSMITAVVTYLVIILQFGSSFFDAGDAPGQNS